MRCLLPDDVVTVADAARHLLEPYTYQLLINEDVSPYQSLPNVLPDGALIPVEECLVRGLPKRLVLTIDVGARGVLIRVRRV